MADDTTRDLKANLEPDLDLEEVEEESSLPVLDEADFTFLADQGAAAGTAVGTVTATDLEGDAVTFAITGGNTGGAFAIDPATGKITVANSAAVVGGPFTLTVSATDNGTPNQTGSGTVTVNVNGTVTGWAHSPAW